MLSTERDYPRRALLLILVLSRTIIQQQKSTGQVTLRKHSSNKMVDLNSFCMKKASLNFRRSWGRLENSSHYFSLIFTKNISFMVTGFLRSCYTCVGVACCMFSHFVSEKVNRTAITIEKCNSSCDGDRFIINLFICCFILHWSDWYQAYVGNQKEPLMSMNRSQIIPSAVWSFFVNVTHDHSSFIG